MNKIYIKEVALAATIMADHVSDKLFMQMHEHGVKEPYLICADLISSWAIEFVNKYKRTNWQEVMKKGMKPLSRYYQVIHLPVEAYGDFSFYKLDNLNQMRVV